MPVHFDLWSDEQKAEAIGKLPKWAHDYIVRLERDNYHLRRERAEMTGDESPIWHMPDYQTKLHLPKRTTVVFRLEGGNVEFDLRDGEIKVSASGDQVCIMPVVSNAFTIGFKGK